MVGLRCDQKLTIGVLCNGQGLDGAGGPGGQGTIYNMVPDRPTTKRHATYWGFNNLQSGHLSDRFDRTHRRKVHYVVDSKPLSKTVKSPVTRFSAYFRKLAFAKKAKVPSKVIAV